MPKNRLAAMVQSTLYSAFGKEHRIPRLKQTSSVWWGVLLLAIIALGGSLALIPQEDFWWHMKIGDWIRANGAIPRTALYSGTRANDAFFYQSWGSEWLFSALYDLGGLAAIMFTRNLLLIATYGLLLWHTLRRTNTNGRAGLVALLLAAAVAFDNWGVRPQTFSWLLFAATFVILSEVSVERISPKALLALPLIEMLWVNLHGAFTLGPVLAGCAALGASIDRWRDRDDAPTYPTARALWFAVGGMALATLVNPRGWGVIAYVWKLLTDPSSQQLISEWASPLATLDDPVSQLFVLVLLMALIMIAVSWKRLRSADLLTFGAFTVLAITGIRYQLWFGMVAGVIVAEALVLRGRLAIVRDSGKAPRAVAITTLLIAALTVVIQPPLRFALPMPAWTKGANGDLPQAELAVEATPIKAVDWLRANPPTSQLFHEMRYSSYLIWRAGDQIPTFVDTRVELYPIEQWYEYKCILAAKDWEPLLAKYNLTTVLLERSIGEDLIAAMQQSGHWNEQYRDEHSVVLQRNPSAPPPNGSITCPASLATP